MSLYEYFKSRDGLPDANGSLSASFPTQAIACINREVARVLNETTENRI